MSRLLLHIACCVVVVLAVPGCTEEVAAPAGVDEPFSLFGILNPRLAQQTLLVSPVEDRLEPIGETIDAVVTSTDLTSGERHVWKDSVVSNASGQLDHVFRADFRPDFGSRHRIEVQRSDGSSSSVDVEVPIQVTVERDDFGTRNLVARVRGNGVRLNSVETVYSVRMADDWQQTGLRYPVTCTNPEKSYAFSLAGSVVEVEDGFEVSINLGRHFDSITSRYKDDTGLLFDLKFPFSNSLALMSFELRLLVGNEAWDPPGGTFEANVLVQPGTMHNVQDGLGFVGAGYNQDFGLIPSEEAVADTWFFDYVMRPPTDCFDYCSCGYASE